MKGNQVSDDTRKSESETEVSKVSLASERKCTSESTYLPIIRKGLFSDDHFFENVRQNYSQAVKEVLESANEWCCEKDFMQTYRNLRQRNLQVENQAFSVTEDGHTHKVGLHTRYFRVSFCLHRKLCFAECYFASGPPTSYLNKSFFLRL